MRTIRLIGAILIFAWAILGSGLISCSCQGDDEDTEDEGAANDDAQDDDTGDDDGNDDADDDSAPPEGPLIPGPGMAGYDAELEAKARMYDRCFHTFNARALNVNADLSVPVENEEDRALIEEFIRTTDGWDFQEFSGRTPEDVSYWHKVAGLYGGAGIAADAYRYGVLRDQGAGAEEVLIAREHLTRALATLHMATAITGVPGVIARGLARTGIPGTGQGETTTPLFDDFGNPLPEEKNNGTWREDASGGLFPNTVWEDSCSRDQYIGWAAAFGAAWEVIRDDPDFSDDLKDTMQEDARQLALSLSVVRDSGFDLEIWDADGRRTYHGLLNEHAYDRIYIPWLPIKDGMYAIMSLGIVGALAFVAEDDEVDRYLYDHLIAERGLVNIAHNNQVGVDLWIQTNYSASNMAAMGFWLALRYLKDEDARAPLRESLLLHFYDRPGWPRQLEETAQSLFDFVFAAGTAGSSHWAGMFQPPDETAVEQGLQTLREFPDPPYWDFRIVNCDEEEIASRHCVAVDGETEFRVLGYVGRNGTLIVDKPLPMRIRPPSNYHWRSNPYRPNSDGGGVGGSGMLPGVDFRYAYWLGRWAR